MDINFSTHEVLEKQASVSKLINIYLPGWYQQASQIPLVPLRQTEL